MATSRASSRGALLDAALAEFSEHGYEATTVAGIAARAGVTTGALYAHFEGKLDLLVAAIGLASPTELAAEMTRALALPPELRADELGRGLRTDRRMQLLLDVIVLARRDRDVAATLREGLDAYLSSMTSALEVGVAVGVLDPRIAPADLARLGAAVSLGVLVLEALGEAPPGSTSFGHVADALLGEPVADDELDRVRGAASAVEAARDRLHDAIVDAAAAGHSLRRIGDAAGLSHEQVRRVVERHIS